VPDFAAGDVLPCLDIAQEMELSLPVYVYHGWGPYQSLLLGAVERLAHYSHHSCAVWEQHLGSLGVTPG
jgi:hypothetical protein